MPRAVQEIPVTIANGANNSNKIPMKGVVGVAIYVPTITNSKIKLQGSYDGTNFADVKDTTPATVEYATSAGDFWLDLDYIARFLGMPWLRIVSVTAQGAERTFRVFVWQD